MAQSEHLPIYKRSYDLCLYLEQVVRSFSRYHKYTRSGRDLREGRRAALTPSPLAGEGGDGGYEAVHRPQAEEASDRR